MKKLKSAEKALLLLRIKPTGNSIGVMVVPVLGDVGVTVEPI